MRKGTFATTATVVLGVLSLLCLVGCYFALHDIFYDYASPKVLEEHTKLGPGAIPAWTVCPLEWRFLRVCFCLMLFFHVVFLVSVTWHSRSRSAG